MKTSLLWTKNAGIAYNTKYVNDIGSFLEFNPFQQTFQVNPFLYALCPRVNPCLLICLLLLFYYEFFIMLF